MFNGMPSPTTRSTTTIGVFKRHNPQCPKKTDRYRKRCKCRKALYIYKKGLDAAVSAKTRLWEQVEQFAQAERDRRDPVKRQLKEIEDQEAQKAELQKTKNITVAKGAERWLHSVKTKTAETATTYIESRVAHQSEGSRSRITECAGLRSGRDGRVARFMGKRREERVQQERRSGRNGPMQTSISAPSSSQLHGQR
jgi:hypothetical protein